MTYEEFKRKIETGELGIKELPHMLFVPIVEHCDVCVHRFVCRYKQWFDDSVTRSWHDDTPEMRFWCAEFASDPDLEDEGGNPDDDATPQPPDFPDNV